MAINYDGRLEVRFFYQVSTASDPAIQHRHSIDFVPQEISEVEPGMTFDQIVTRWHSGSVSQSLDADVDAYVALILEFLADTEAEMSHAEVWKYGEEPSVDPVFVASYPIALAGTNLGATQLAGQWTMTHRTIAGGIMRTQIMEFAGANQFLQQSPPFTPASATLAFSNYMISTAHPWVGRDNTRPIATIRLSLSQNEKLFRKRYRTL